MMLGAKDTSTGISYNYLTYAAYPIYDGGGNRLAVYEDGNWRGDSLKGISATTWQYFRFEVLPTAGANYFNGTTFDNATKYYSGTYSAASPLKVGFSNDNQAFQLVYARVRRYSATPPTVSVTGAKVSLGSCATFVTGVWTSNPSVTASATTPAWSKPTGLTATAISDTQINLSWTRNTSDETGFAIQRCTAPNGQGSCSSFSALGTTGAGVTIYSDSPLSASTTYCYQVQATKSVPGGCGGGWSTTYSTSACDLVFPAHATSLTANWINSESVRLNWSNNGATDEDGYEVEAQAWNGMWVNIAKLPGPVNSYVHARGLQPGKTYNYRVRPYRGVDESPYSNVATVTLPAFSASPPTCQ
jgi:hypothetical protein